MYKGHMSVLSSGLLCSFCIQSLAHVVRVVLFVVDLGSLFAVAAEVVFGEEPSYPDVGQ